MIAIYIDYKLQRFMNEIKYSFRYIFDNRGLAYRFVKDEQELKPNDIFIIYGMAEPEAEELKAIARHYITIFILCEPELYEKGSYSPDKLRRNLRDVKLLYSTKIISGRAFSHVAENYIDEDTCGGKINFDLVGNVFFQLSFAEYSFEPSPKGDDRFPDENSAFYPYREYPVLDSLMWLIESMIKEHARAQKIPLAQKAFWPQNQGSAVLLSHTVDDLQKWDLSSLVLSVVDDFILLFTLKFQQYFHTVWGKLQYLFTNYELYWNFHEYLQLERENGCRSTFFLATDKGTEIDYSLDDPELQEEIQTIINEGSEIGLLMPNDKLNRDDMMTRKQIMLHQLAQDRIGVRQYAYTTNSDILDLHNKISPRYSQSVAFRDTPGFFSGISFPFTPWVGAKASYLMLPTTYRDSYLHVNKHKLLALDDAKAQIKRYFQQIQRTHGVFALDLSLAAYNDIHYCHKLYSYVLALVTSASTWVTTAMELSDWWEKRNKVTIEESEYEISLFFPEALAHFTLQLHTEQKVREIDGQKAKIEGNNLFFTDVKAESFCVIRLVQ
ncbi:MAG: hypothetical protein PHY21_09460 [Candidatus Cloacimonetes bacterium]|nr:hypothetical protein [Candidatus Cloacimonadota bacterium]